MPIALRAMLAVGVVIGAANCALAQCGPSGCVVPTPREQTDSAPAAVRRAYRAVVRVVHRAGDGASLGSGVVVRGDDGSSYVLTCAHLFDGLGSTEVVRGAMRISARVVAIDRANDLALLQTQLPAGPGATVSTANRARVMTACGYGPKGVFRAVRGPVVGSATAQGATAPSFRLRGAVRSGDSGGPVFDDSGRVVAVVWGQRNGETYAMGGGPLTRLLSRLSRPRELTPIARRDPRAAPVSRQAPTVQPPSQPWGALPSDSENRREPNRREPTDDRIDRFESPALSWPPVRRGAPPAPAYRRWPFSDAWPLLAAAAGPTAIAALLALRLWLGSRDEKDTKGTQTVTRVAGASRPVAVDTPPPPQRVVPQTHYVSYENDAFAQAHQWASEQLARKFPGSVELLTGLDSLIRQKLNADRD